MPIMGKDMMEQSRFAVKAFSLLAPIVAVGVGGCVWMADAPCSLPDRGDIAGMAVTDEFWAFDGDRQIPAFEIPEKHWDAVLAALEPCEPDALPAAWVSLCDLSIRTKANRHYRMNLYWLDDARRGAFSVSLGGRSPKKTYYRGGNSVQLRNAIVAAYDESAHLAPRP